MMKKAIKIYDISKINNERLATAEVYKNLMNKYIRTNAESDLKEIAEVKLKITNRITELENFIQENLWDPRISSFNKAKNQYKKIIDEEIDENYDLDSHRALSKGSLRSKSRSRSPKVKKKTSDSKVNTNIKLVVGAQSILDAGFAAQNMKKKVNKSSSLPQKAEGNDTSRGRTAKSKTPGKKPKQKEELVGRMSIQEDAYLGFKNSNNLKEITFNIKLNEQEYNLIMQSKTRASNQSFVSDQLNNSAYQ